MNATVLELPEDEAEWPNWLERQLVGLELRLFVRQLEIVSGQSIELAVGETWSNRLEADFGHRLPEILQRGLDVLSRAELQQLFRSPRLLLALQERIFVDGSGYWDSIPRTQEHLALSESVKRRVLAQIESASVKSREDVPNALKLGREDVNSERITTPRRITTRRNTYIILALAATAALCMFLVRPSSENRFFARQGLLTSSQRDASFLKSLATAIEDDWQSDADANKFKRQLRDLRDSCDRLLAADLAQLDSAVATDLKNRCRNWRAAFTQLLDDLNAGRPIAEIRVEANAFVDRLVEVLPTLG